MSARPAHIVVAPADVILPAAITHDAGSRAFSSGPRGGGEVFGAEGGGRDDCAGDGVDGVDAEVGGGAGGGEVADLGDGGGGLDDDGGGDGGAVGAGGGGAGAAGGWVGVDGADAD